MNDPDRKPSIIFFAALGGLQTAIDGGECTCEVCKARRHISAMILADAEQTLTEKGFPTV